MSNIRHLPIVLEPACDESLASYVAGLARMWQVPFKTILHDTGLLDAEHRRRPRGYGVALAPARQSVFARSTGLTTGQVGGMLLSTYEGRLLSLRDFNPEHGPALSLYTHGEWAYFVGSHACPLCLAERNGAWKLRWKLPWSFACVEHKLLLLDECAVCHLPLCNAQQKRPAPFYLSIIPPAGRCENSQPTKAGRVARFCGADLTAQSAVDLGGSPRLLEAQGRLDAAIDGRTMSFLDDQITSAEYILLARALTAWTVRFANRDGLGPLPRAVATAFNRHVAERSTLRTTRGGDTTRRRFYNAVPRHTAAVAAVMPFVTETLAAESMNELIDRLRPVAEAMHAVIGRQRKGLGKRYRLPQVLVDALDHAQPGPAGHRIWRASPTARPESQPQSSSPSATPTPRRLQMVASPSQEASTRSSSRLRPEHVPALLWEDVWLECFADLLPTVRTVRARFFVSRLLVRTIWQYDWATTARLGGLAPEGMALLCSSFCTRLNRTGGAEEARLRIDALAEALNKSPLLIDYAERREAFADFSAIPDEQWVDLVARAGISPGKRGARQRHAATWLWSELTGGLPAYAPAIAALTDDRIPGTSTPSSPLGTFTLYRRFEKRDLPALRGELTKLGHRLLRDAGGPGLDLHRRHRGAVRLGEREMLQPVRPGDVWRALADDVAA